MNITMLLHGIGVIVGLYLVWQASDYVISYVLRLARHYNVSTFFVGFVLLALAADIPDLAISIIAAFQGVGQLAAGDVIGACFNDVALTIGCTLVVARSIVMKKREALGFLRLILSSALVMAGVFCIGKLTPFHGVVLVSLYGAFLYWAWQHRHEHVLLEVTSDDLHHPKPLPSRGLLIVWSKVIAAIVGVLSGSGLAVHCGVVIAQAYGFALESVGATIIALGTSLPEISMGFHAYRRGEYTLALGPTIGTVFSQSTFVLGVLALCSRFPIDLSALQGAAAFMFTAFLVIAVSILLDRIGRFTGVVLVTLFILYMMYHVVGV
ncbi:sodium:calcium antiporter [Candidatus Dependentiae bacterium]|nr:sodium:calcium antiporter [Candidatus Dependentiae bacterium]